MARNYFKPGEWNIICMVCNRKIKSGEALKRWDGLIVCPEDFENRHPMDFLRSRQEKISVPFESRTSYDQFDGPGYPPYPFCSAPGSSGVAGWATAGCMRPALGFPNGLPVTAPEIPDEPTYVNLVYVSNSQFVTLMSGGFLLTASLDE